MAVSKSEALNVHEWKSNVKKKSETAHGIGKEFSRDWNEREEKENSDAWATYTAGD